MIVLDTNVIIYYSQNDPKVVRWIEQEIKQGTLFVISTMSVVELLSFPNVSLRETFLIERVLRSARVIDVDMSHAREAARLRIRYGLKAIDAVIAATASIFDIPLASRDKIFSKLTELNLIDL